VSGADVLFYYGPGNSLRQTLSAPLGSIELSGAWDLPFTGGRLTYDLVARTFARLAGPFAGNQYALDGAAAADVTFRFTRFAVLDAGGRDVTDAAGLRSAVFTLGAGGVILSGTVTTIPEPGTLALAAAGGTALLAWQRPRARRRRR
jgi:hypothetical protein